MRRHIRTREDWEGIITEKLSYAKEAARLDRAGRDKADTIAEEGVAALIEYIRAPADKSIWHSKDSLYEVAWALRHLGRLKAVAAHTTLVAELRKLLRSRGFIQREIVNALADIHGSDKRIDSNTMSVAQEVAVMEWWLARPEPDDVGDH